MSSEKSLKRIEIKTSPEIQTIMKMIGENKQNALTKIPKRNDKYLSCENEKIAQLNKIYWSKYKLSKNVDSARSIKNLKVGPNVTIKLDKLEKSVPLEKSILKNNNLDQYNDILKNHSLKKDIYIINSLQNEIFSMNNNFELKEKKKLILCKRSESKIKFENPVPIILKKSQKMKENKIIVCNEIEKFDPKILKRRSNNPIIIDLTSICEESIPETNLKTVITKRKSVRLNKLNRIENNQIKSESSLHEESNDKLKPVCSNFEKTLLKHLKQEKCKVPTLSSEHNLHHVSHDKKFSNFQLILKNNNSTKKIRLFQIEEEMFTKTFQQNKLIRLENKFIDVYEFLKSTKWKTINLLPILKKYMNKFKISVLNYMDRPSILTMNLYELILKKLSYKKRIIQSQYSLYEMYLFHKMIKITNRFPKELQNLELLGSYIGRNPNAIKGKMYVYFDEVLKFKKDLDIYEKLIFTILKDESEFFRIKSKEKILSKICFKYKKIIRFSLYIDLYLLDIYSSHNINIFIDDMDIVMKIGQAFISDDTQLISLILKRYSKNPNPEFTLSNFGLGTVRNTKFLRIIKSFEESIIQKKIIKKVCSENFLIEQELDIWKSNEPRNYSQHKLSLTNKKNSRKSKKSKKSKKRRRKTKFVNLKRNNKSSLLSFNQKFDDFNPKGEHKYEIKKPESHKISEDIDSMNPITQSIKVNLDSDRSVNYDKQLETIVDHEQYPTLGKRKMILRNRSISR